MNEEINGILTKEIEKVVNLVVQKSTPVSVFVYGSRARDDYEAKSDFEVGVLYEEGKEWGRRDLARLHKVEGLNIYPFKIKDFCEYKLDTPFPKVLYMREMVGSAQTVTGEKVLESLALPEVRLMDLFEGAVFEVATAYAAYRSEKEKDHVTAAISFTKSVFFGTRVLLVLRKSAFSFTYTQILEESRGLDLKKEYRDLLEHAMEVRKGSGIKWDTLFTNISFQNKAVLREVRDALIEGDRVVLSGKKVW